MSTKITNKQVKIISNVDFNEKEIENAIIDAEKNEITNLDIPTKVSDLENDSGYTTVADVNSEIIANSNSIDQELNENSYNAVTNNAIVKGIDVNKTSVVDSIVDTLPSGTLSLGQSVYNTTDKKIYKTVYSKQINDEFYKVTGTLSVNNTNGDITDFSENDYISFSDYITQEENINWASISIQKFVFSLSFSSYTDTATIFSIIRKDDNSILFGIDYTSGYGGTLSFYTKKRDGTKVDSYSIYNAAHDTKYELEITKSCYIKLINNGKTEVIRYFGSLEPSTEIDNDFYYDIPADIKISSKRITQYSPYIYTIGLNRVYGIESKIGIQTGSIMPSMMPMIYTDEENVVWDEGTLIEKNKLLCDATTNILYKYNGNALEEISPNLEDYQKKLTAGDNITISGEGYINFSDTNYLKFINNVLPVQTSTSRDFIIKFNLSELNRNNTLIYSIPSTNKYWYLEINNENKLSCTYINSSGTLRTVTGTHTFQANKDYWVYVTATLSYPQGVFFIEDNGYNLSSLPTTISGWTFDFEGTYDNIMMSIFYNQEVYLGYNLTNTANYLKGAIGECAIKRSQNQNIFILSEAVESSSFINNGCLKGPAISAIIPEIDSQLSDVSENAVQNKVIDAALKSMQPVVVTSSGDSLPATTGFIEGNTFLNTTDKKIYKAEMTIESYELNTDVTNEGITVDLQTGVASGFVPAGVGVYTPKGIRHDNLNILWKEPITLNFHFNITETRNNQVIATLYQGGYGYKCVSFYIANDNKIYLTYTQGSGGPSTQSNIFLLADYQLLLNTEYFVEINKNGTNVTTTISTQGYNISPEYEETINNVEDWYPSDNYSYLIYGYYNMGPLSGGQSVFSGSIYLADSFGEFLLPVRTMSWDSGTSILNSTGYIDKANGILHYYESPDLISIGGGSGALTKKVYKFNSDNITTLDVSSDFTKVVDVLKNGVELVLTDDYTISSGVITFVTALSTTDKITVKGE